MSIVTSRVFTELGSFDYPSTEFPQTTWHFGDPFGEQRRLSTHAGSIHRAHQAILVLRGADRLSWLNALTTQQVNDLAVDETTTTLILNARGHIEHLLHLTNTVDATYISTEAHTVIALEKYLTSMIFWADVTIESRPDLTVISVLGPNSKDVLEKTTSSETVNWVHSHEITPPRGLSQYDIILPRCHVPSTLDVLEKNGGPEVGLWAYEALRVESLQPRLGLDIDDRTIPHEVRLIGDRSQRGAVHLDKGCYRGQETVARVHNLGRPPRRLVLLYLDGSTEQRPTNASAIRSHDRRIGTLGTVIDHHERGPIALALIKRDTPADAELVIETDDTNQHSELLSQPCTARIDQETYSDADWVNEGTPAGRVAINRLFQDKNPRITKQK